MSIQTDNVSSSTTVSRLISPECIQHFAVQPRVSVLEWAHTNSNSVILYPQTYFSTSDSFTLTPQSYIVATICDVPANRHTVGNCSLLRGAFDPVQYAVCLVVTNISHAIQIDVVSGLNPVQGHRSFLTMIDMYTGYVIAVPLKHETTAEISKIIENSIIKTFPFRIGNRKY